MKKHNVKSSTINSFYYFPTTHILGIEFIRGQIYHYFDVPHEIYSTLLKLKNNKKSIGSYFHKEIKSNYAYKKMFEEDSNIE